MHDSLDSSLPLSTFRDTLSWLQISYKKESVFVQRDEEKTTFNIYLHLDSDKLVFIDDTGTEDNICALYGYSEICKRSHSTKDAFTKQRLSTIRRLYDMGIMR